jgi:hypothetical protein
MAQPSRRGDYLGELGWKRRELIIRQKVTVKGSILRPFIHGSIVQSG